MAKLNEQPNELTKKCPKCQEDIQLGAKKCKHCGSDLRNWFVRHKIITGILVLFLIGAISSAMNEGEEKTINNSNNNSDGAANLNIVYESKNDEIIPAENKSALNKAMAYANTMHMSKQGVYDQLVSEYGEKFSTVAAQYAIENIETDWNANALAKAKTYRDTMNMSPAAIHDQLVSEYGENFTQAEADYAIQHLND